MGMLKFALFEVKPIAFPITKEWLDPETLASSTPGLTVRLLVENHIPRRICVTGPIGNQIYGTKSMQFGERHIWDVATLTFGYRYSAQ